MSRNAAEQIEAERAALHHLWRQRLERPPTKPAGCDASIDWTLRRTCQTERGGGNAGLIAGFVGAYGIIGVVTAMPSRSPAVLLLVIPGLALLFTAGFGLERKQKAGEITKLQGLKILLPSAAIGLASGLAIYALITLAA